MTDPMSHADVSARAWPLLPLLFFLVVFANIFVANNTVAIVLTGEMARDIASDHGVDLRRSASVLDIFSCVVQV